MAALPEPRIFNDSVHGPIQLDPLLVMIIDTPQFQRLRDIKQLGVCYWVYPGASHNRFEHCIGSSYICSEMINRLRSVHRKPPAAQANEKPTATQADEEPPATQANEKPTATRATVNETEELITDYESLCLQIAALCRDLGYGPFSHFFHEVLVPRLMDSRAQASGSSNENDRTIKWARDASCKMFDFMLKENRNLKDALDNSLKKLKNKSRSKSQNKNWQEFIKALICGKDSKDVEEKCSFEGSRDLKMSFLYEMVSNKRTRIDCNKFDYISRDCHNVGVKSNFDWRRYLLTICIKKVEDNNESELQIHPRDKDHFNRSDLYYVRWSLYHRVYRHKTIAGIEDMLSEAILKADTKLKISNTKLKISDLIKDDWLLKEDDESMKCYTKLTDRIFYQVLELEEQERSQSEEASGGLHVQERSQSEEATGGHAQEHSQSEEAFGARAQESSQSEQERSQSEEASGSQSEQATGGRAQERCQLIERKGLLENIQQRNLYTFCGQAELKEPRRWKAYEKKKVIAKEIADKSYGQVLEGGLYISFPYFHFGKEGEDPMKDGFEVTKSGQQQKPVSNMSWKLHECYIRVYAKPGQNKKNVQDAFNDWYDGNDKVIRGTLKLNDSVKSTQRVEG